MKSSASKAGMMSALSKTKWHRWSEQKDMWQQEGEWGGLRESLEEWEPDTDVASLT